MKQSTLRRAAAGALACLTSVGALSFGAAMPAHAAGAPTLDRVLGGSRKINEFDDEFRMDFVVRVPAGDLINHIDYTYDFGGTWWTANEVAGTGTGQEYQIVNRTNVGADDLVAITLRGDANIDVPCPSQSVTASVRVFAPGGTLQFSDPTPWVVYNHNEACAGNGMPDVNVPSDNWWSAPSGNSQSGFGAITSTGVIANTANTFILQADNTNFGRLTNDCEVTDSMAYQWVHEDNTPSNLTPTPVTAAVVPNLGDVTKALTLGTQNFTGDSPGYYKLLVWPNAHNANNGNSPDCTARNFTPGDVNNAFQVGSVFYNFNAASSVVPMTGGEHSTLAVVGGMSASLLAGAWLIIRRRQVAIPGEL